ILDFDRRRWFVDRPEVTGLQRDGVWIIADRDRIKDDDHEQNHEQNRESERADHALPRSNQLFRLSGSRPRKPAEEAVLVEPIEDPRDASDDPDEMPKIDLADAIGLKIDRAP